MKSICFFASYFTSTNLPYYIQVYLLELKKHFSEVVLYTSQVKLNKNSHDFLDQNKINLRIEVNAGFDFGMWYKAFDSYPVMDYNRIALVNDSCVLFKSLHEFMNWASNNSADFKGITLSEAIAPHIQSYFILMEKKAIPFVSEYFKQHGVLNDIKKVIQTYEIGLSTYLLSKKLKIAAYIDNNGYSGEYSPYYYCVNYHLEKGIPLIKKKILFASYRKDELVTLARMNFKISPNHYLNLINRSESELIIDFSKIKEINKPQLHGLSRIKYDLTRLLVKFKRALKF